MKTFKHSGATGDLIYSLPIVKYLGGGDFFLHLNQMDWIGQHYYGSQPDPFHQGRLTLKDFEYMRPFMESQDYISRFSVFDPRAHEITHNLDRFRVPFVGHPGNYIDIYADVFGLDDPEVKAHLRNTPWLQATPKYIPGKPVVINRTRRWIPPTPSPEWQSLKQHFGSSAVFVGLESEHRAFCSELGWNIDYYPTQTQKDLAEVIAGCEQYIGNQSQGLALAFGLGSDILVEVRRDLPRERNECYFPDRPHTQWF